MHLSVVYTLTEGSELWVEMQATTGERWLELAVRAALAWLLRAGHA